MARFVKKTKKWPVYRADTESEWKWFWDSVTSCVPYWDAVQGDNIAPVDIVTGLALTKISTPVWTIGTHGQSATIEGTGESWELAGNETDYLPRATHGSILSFHRKTDATNRGSSLCGLGTSVASEVTPYVPFSDGIVYWDFGGQSGDRRISVSGLNVAGPQAWGFTAGPTGMNIWQDGVSKQSNTAAAVRTVSTITFRVGRGRSASDLREHMFFAVLDSEVTGSQMLQWARDPFGPIRRFDEAAVIFPVVAPGGGVVWSLAHKGGLAGPSGLAGQGGGLAG